MRVITEDVAARLRRRGYDAAHGRWETIHGATETTDFIVVNAVTVIGWRYPDGDWLWDDRPAYLVDKGVDPLRRSAQQPRQHPRPMLRPLPQRRRVRHHRPPRPRPSPRLRQALHPPRSRPVRELRQDVSGPRRVR